MKTGGPAFPVQDMAKSNIPGMTLRDYFASMALQALIFPHDEASEVARKAYECADAMLTERERPAMLDTPVDGGDFV